VPPEYEALSVEVDAGVAFVTLDHPPVNLLDATMIGDLWSVANRFADDDTARVVVVRSADTEFFVAHADLRLIQQLPRDVTERGTELAVIHQFMERWRTLPQVTIAQIDGRARGGGSEFVLSLDLRFAARGRAVLSQPVAERSASRISSAGGGHSRSCSGVPISTPIPPSATGG
jgi:enoyl-CoA hydratase/carnithine racemase